MNIREAASASGLSTDTIRFYEKKGFLPKPPRRENGYRDYSHEHVLVLRLANGLRQLDLPLTEVGPLLQVAHDGTCRDVRQQVSATLDRALPETEERLSHLAQGRDQMATIRAGIAEASPGEAEVPGLNPCSCVRMISEV